MKKIIVLFAIALFLTLVSVPVSAKSLLDCNKERSNDRISLACNIYFESRSEPIIGQWAVAMVTRNRVNSNLFPNTYSEVVWDIRRNFKTHRKVPQFSWVLDGKSDKIRNKNAWSIAWDISGVVIDQTLMVPDFTDGALWYYANYVKPKWHDKYSRVISIGKHIFYK